MLYSLYSMRFKAHVSEHYRVMHLCLETPAGLGCPCPVFWVNTDKMVQDYQLWDKTRQLRFTAEKKIWKEWQILLFY